VKVAFSRPFLRSTRNTKRFKYFRREPTVDRLRVGWLLVRSQEERICSVLGPTQSRISPSIIKYTKIDNLTVVPRQGLADQTFYKSILRESAIKLSFPDRA